MVITAQTNLWLSVDLRRNLHRLSLEYSRLLHELKCPPASMTYSTLARQYGLMYDSRNPHR